ncbi:MAG: hypothetical protein IV093_17850 [Rubrivivax sp.]|nr:hypothetical protein [Rubrivivax sp.]
MPKPVRTRVKACGLCQVVSTTLFRVVHDAPNQWVLICGACRAKVETQPLYRYGGTWKADKRH